MTDYYQLLGVAYDDPPQKIRARFRQLARHTHPDLAGDAKIPEFARYVQAYRALERPEARKRYNAQIGVYIVPRSLYPGTDLYQRLYITSAQATEGAVIPLTFTRYEPCQLCWLTGCSRCNQQGMFSEQVTVDVKVQPGARNGTKVLLEGQGGCAEPGGSRGNLFVYISISSDAAPKSASG